MTNRTRFIVASLLPFLSSVSLTSCGENSTDSGNAAQTVGAGGTTGGGGAGTGGAINNGAAGGGVGTGAGNTTGGNNLGVSGSAAGGSTVTGNTGGMTGNAGGMTGNVGGNTGNTGGTAGNTGGMTGNTGGTPANTGGMTGGGDMGGAPPAGGSDGGGNGGAGGGPVVDGVNVQMDKTRQPIQGFGINSALMPSNKSLPMNDLFGMDGANAIGLSILRIGMDENGNLTGQGIDEARNAGAKIIGSTWSPPPNCKSDGSVNDGGHLITPDEDGGSCYDSWSDTIANFAGQYNLYAMSIANESDFASCPGVPVCTTSYPTTTYTAKQMVEWVKKAGPKLAAKGVKVIAPEASEWIHAWSNSSGTGSIVSSHPDSSDPLGCGCFANTLTDEGCAQKCLDGDGYDYGHWLWKDQDAWGAFDILGVHEYDSQIAFPWPADVNDGVRDKEVWQTEMSGVMHWPEQGPSTDINNGVAVAGWIHSALTVGEASAWLYWWYEAYYDNDNEGLAITQGSSTIAKRYFALGNYSKFVRPGFTAVEVAGADDENVLISAYTGDSGQVVVVAINKGDAAAEFPITITGGTAPTSMTPNVTSADANLAAGTAVPVMDGVFTASLPPKTITSFVSQ